MRVAAEWVVEVVDVVADGIDRGVAGIALVVDQLRLERGEEALCDGVVPAVAGATHAGDDAVHLKGPAIVLAGVRAAAVGVVHEAAGGLRTERARPRPSRARPRSFVLLTAQPTTERECPRDGAGRASRRLGHASLRDPLVPSRPSAGAAP